MSRLLSPRTKRRDRHRLAGAAILLLALVYISTNLLSSVRDDGIGGFEVLRSLRMSPAFADLRHLTTLSGCSDAILDIDRGTAVGCDHWGRKGLGYPPLIFFITRALGVAERQTEFIALVVGCSFLMIVVGRYWRVFIDQGWCGMWLCIAILKGMPVQLGLERMNLDLAIFSLMYLLCRIMTSPPSGGSSAPVRKLAESTLVVLVSFIISGTKIYPGVGLLLWLIYNKDRRIVSRLNTLSCGFGAIGGLFIGIAWLVTGSRTAAPGIGLISHGLYLGHGESPLSIAEVALALTTFVMTLVIGKSLYGAQHSKECRSLLSPFAVLTSLTWISCFIVGPSFDYRLILLVPSICELSAYGYRRYRKHRIASIDAGYIRFICKSAPIVYIVLCLSPIVYFANEHYTKASIVDSQGVASIAGLAFKYMAFYATRAGDLVGLPYVCASLIIVLLVGSINFERSQMTASPRLIDKE